MARKTRAGTGGKGRMTNPEDEARISKLWAENIPPEYRHRPGLNPTERGPGHGGVVVPDEVKKGSTAAQKKGK
jgi:hypothetical protein